MERLMSDISKPINVFTPDVNVALSEVVVDGGCIDFKRYI